MSTSHSRQSTGSKTSVALPKSEIVPNNSVQQTVQPPSMVSQEAALYAAVGSRVRITTSSPASSTVEGIIYTADPITSLLILHISPSTSTAISPSHLRAPVGSYRIIPLSQISSFQLQSPQPATNAVVGEQPQPQPQADSSSNSLDTAALQARLAKSISIAQTRATKIGPAGTTPQTQALFDALARTMPVMWRGTSMIVSETFIVDKPYISASVRCIEDGRGDIDRMKRVVDMEVKKIALKMSEGNGIRKGG